jgi:hypothetical protein
VGKDKDEARSTAEAKEEDKARHVIVTNMAHMTGSVAVVSEEDRANHLTMAIVAIVAKETKMAHKAESRHVIVAKTRTKLMSKEDDIAS